ncbi:MAG: ExbD/TolR family protein [Planctomycetota bacterium]|jgi:biopolymer transport protein ExbD
MMRRKKRLKPVVPIASMGDIAFLLIIFFMLTSNFMKNRGIELEEARSSDLVALKKTHVTVTIDEESVLRLQGEICEPALLENAVAAVLKDRDDKRVELKIDKDVLKKDYQPVFMALGRAGAKVALVGQKEEP